MIRELFSVLDAVHEYSVFPTRFDFMDAVSGEVLTPIDFGQFFKDCYGYPYISRFAMA